MNYTVKALKSQREWEGPNGTVVYYKLELEGIDELAEIGQKPDKPPPAAGQVIDGDLSDPDPKYGTRKLKKVYNQQGGGGKGWQPPAPEEIAAMRRSGAQNRALEAAKLSQGLGLLEGKIGDRDDLTKVLLFFTNFFDADVAAAAEKAKA